MPVRGCPGRTAPPTHAGRSVLACTGHPQTVHQTNLTSLECPRLYGASERRGLPRHGPEGVSSLVRGILPEGLAMVFRRGSVLACTGHPLSKPLQNQGSATLGNPKNFSLPHTRGHDHLAAVSFKSHTTSSTAA